MQLYKKITLDLLICSSNLLFIYFLTTFFFDSLSNFPGRSSLTYVLLFGIISLTLAICIKSLILIKEDRIFEGIVIGISIPSFVLFIFLAFTFSFLYDLSTPPKGVDKKVWINIIND